MIDDKDWEFFDANGYILLHGVLDGDDLRRIKEAFDEVWESEGPPCTQHKLLKYAPFIELIEHPPILDQHWAIFGSQTQLLQYDLLRQGPGNDGPLRGWHRDFSFPGDYPLSINTIVYLDPMTDEERETLENICVVDPATHRLACRARPTGPVVVDIVYD